MENITVSRRHKFKNQKLWGTGPRIEVTTWAFKSTSSPSTRILKQEIWDGAQKAEYLINILGVV